MPHANAVIYTDLNCEEMLQREKALMRQGNSVRNRYAQNVYSVT